VGEQRKKTATLNLRIDPALKVAAETAAAADHRSLTSLVEKLLADYLLKSGRLTAARGRGVDAPGQKIDALDDQR